MKKEDFRTLHDQMKQLKKEDFRTLHDLSFLSYNWSRNETFRYYQVGTCIGLYLDTKKFIRIVAIINDDPHNGHLEDVFQWFERLCQISKKTLMITDFFNERFRIHCILKRGFIPVIESINDDVLIKPIRGVSFKSTYLKLIECFGIKIAKESLTEKEQMKLDKLKDKLINFLSL